MNCSITLILLMALLAPFSGCSTSQRPTFTQEQYQVAREFVQNGLKEGWIMKAESGSYRIYWEPTAWRLMTFDQKQNAAMIACAYVDSYTHEGAVFIHDGYSGERMCKYLYGYGLDCDN